MARYRYKGKIYDIKKSKRKNKQMVVTLPSGKKINFGDPKMSEYPGTKRGDRYCSRSLGIGNVKNTKSANFWSRKFLWNCKGKKSLKSRKAAGIKRV